MELNIQTNYTWSKDRQFFGDVQVLTDAQYAANTLVLVSLHFMCVPVRQKWEIFNPPNKPQKK